jgi:hypothetical protein
VNTSTALKMTPHARYTIAICKGSALLSETKALLRAWRPGEPLSSFTSRVLRDDVLGRATAYRVKDIVRRVFARRFLVPDSAPAEHLKALIRHGHGGRIFSDICLLYAARNDDLLRDVIVRLFWPALADGRLELSVEDVVEFIRGAENEGLMLAPWSEQVKIKVARGLVKALVDFRYLREVGRRRRETVVYRPTDPLVTYLPIRMAY